MTEYLDYGYEVDNDGKKHNIPHVIVYESGGAPELFVGFNENNKPVYKTYEEKQRSKSSYKGIPKRSIRHKTNMKRKMKTRKIKSRSQYAKKALKKVRKTRKDKGVKRGPRKSM